MENMSVVEWPTRLGMADRYFRYMYVLETCAMELCFEGVFSGNVIVYCKKIHQHQTNPNLKPRMIKVSLNKQWQKHDKLQRYGKILIFRNEETF